MRRSSVVINISSSGDEASYVYDDALHEALSSEGASVIQRASQCEPCADGTWAIDIFSGPIVFGFATRQEALEAEVAYLENVLLPSR